MSKCTCREDNREVIEAGAMFNTPKEDIPMIPCRRCVEEQRREEAEFQKMNEEADARLRFFQMSSTERWGEVFEFMYERGYRP